MFFVVSEYRRFSASKLLLLATSMILGTGRLAESTPIAELLAFLPVAIAVPSVPESVTYLLNSFLQR